VALLTELVVRDTVVVVILRAPDPVGVRHVAQWYWAGVLAPNHFSHNDDCPPRKAGNTHVDLAGMGCATA
jgi:hypothetical protein